MIENVWSPSRVILVEMGWRQAELSSLHSPHSVVIISENQKEVDLKSLRQADAKLGPDRNTGETIRSIVILPNMFHPVLLQYRLFTPVQQFSISRYVKLIQVL
jgi:hypothetical protein